MKKLIALATAICLSFGVAVAQQQVAPQKEVKTEKTHKCSHDGKDKDHKCSKDAKAKDHKCSHDGKDHKCSKDAKERKCCNPKECCKDPKCCKDGVCKQEVGKCCKEKK